MNVECSLEEMIAGLREKATVFNGNSRLADFLEQCVLPGWKDRKSLVEVGVKP